MRYLIYSVLFFIHAMHASYCQSHSIHTLYHHIHKKSLHTSTQRITYISQFFLGKPYELYPLGEGHDDIYDQFPKIRLDAFDCQTYVDTVLALTLACDAKDFPQWMDNIRYDHGHVSFLTRHHFTSIDWNTHHQKSGYLQDITTTFKDVSGQSIAAYSTTRIEKNNWYRALPLKTIRNLNLSDTARQETLRHLQQQGAQQFKPQVSVLAYLPLAKLLPQGQPNLFIFNQIPSGAIIEIVRPHWHTSQDIGTALDVSHIGFAIRHHHQLYFREASSIEHRIIDIPLITYLQEASRNPTIGGINVQIMPDQTLNKIICAQGNRPMIR